MTGDWRSSKAEHPFDAWVRSKPELDSVRECIVITDTDKWIHRYGFRRTKWGVDREVQYLMMVERKTHGADMTDSQRDTLHIVNQLLGTVPWKEQRLLGRLVSGHSQNTRIVYSTLNRRKVQIICYGVHKLRLSGASPKDSAWITWDDKEITEQQLVGLFRFDLNPVSLRPLEHRTHKRRFSMDALFPDDFHDVLPPDPEEQS